MSPPAEKARSPAPVTTMRVTAASFAQASSCAASALTMPCVTALSAFGRFSVTSPAAPRRSNRISSVLKSATRSIPQHRARDDDAHDLVGAFEDLVHAHVAQHALDGMVAQIAVAAVHLQAAIDDVEAGVGGEALR